MCGLGHYRMKGYLTIHEEENYQAWLQEQAEYLEEEVEMTGETIVKMTGEMMTGKTSLKNFTYF